MDQHDDFDSVSWKHDPDSDLSRPTTSGTDAEEPQGFDHDANGKRRMSSTLDEGSRVDAVDMDGILECRVDSPLKENDGTKDAYISYLVTTHVGFSLQVEAQRGTAAAYTSQHLQNSS